MNLVKRSWIAIPFAYLLLCSCGGNNDAPDTQDLKKETATDTAPMADTSKYPGGPVQQLDQKVGDQDGPPRNVDWDKKIVKIGSITLEVNNYKRYDELLHGSVSQFGGYIAQEEQNESDYKIENTITIKVPVDQFDRAVRSLTPDSEKVIVKKITSEDVTGEMVDTKSRIEAKKEVRERYMDLLKQAKNMKDILDVQNEINNVQEQIEAAGGRVNYLSHASAFSTIQISFYQVLNAQAKDIKEPDFGQKVLNALKNGFTWIGDLVLLVLTIWPLWLLIGLAWWAIKRWKPAVKPVNNEQSIVNVKP
jgi:hypothetical protein